MLHIHLILALLVVAVWGFNFVVIKVGLEGVPPLFLAFTRFFLTSIPAVLFVKKPEVPFHMIIWFGLIMFALQFAFLFLGMYAGITPSLASLLMQLQVFFSILLAVVVFKERLHIWQIVGGFVAAGGIALVASHFGEGVTLSGFLLVIASAASWGIGNVLSKKIGKVNMLALIVWGSLIAWPPLLLLSLAVEGVPAILDCLTHLTWLSTGTVLYIAYLSTLFAFAIWSWLIHHHPLTTIAPFTLLVPVFGMIGSTLVLGEPLQSWKILAAVLVISGLCINLLGPRLFPRKNK